MKPLCLFGILDNEQGNKIAGEMMRWLAPVYEVFQYRHDGARFELPALAQAQQLSLAEERPVLYIHSRGAVNTWRTTVPTRKMWAEEFGVQWRKYFTIADTNEPVVVTPFVDNDCETRYNGFVANPAAWSQINLQPSADRMIYEHLWRGIPNVKVIGTLMHLEGNDVKKIRQYLYRNFE